ncbi:MAG: hypothetical protein ACRCYE_03645, partial [Sarcina sp.]
KIEKDLKIKKRVEKRENIINLRNNKINICKFKVEDLSKSLEILKKNIEVFKLDGEHNVEFKELQKLKRELKEINREIEFYKSQYSNLLKLESDLKTLIYMGKMYIEKTKMCICPLCSTNHKDYDSLKQKINDKFEDKKELVELEEKIIKLENIKNKYDKLEKEKSENLSRIIAEELKDYEIKKERYIRKNISLKDETEILINKKIENKKEIEQLSSIYNSREIELITKNINTSILKNELKCIIAEEESKVKILIKEIDDKKQEVECLKNSRVDIEKNIERLNYDIAQINKDKIWRNYEDIQKKYQFKLNISELMLEMNQSKDKHKKYIEEKEGINKRKGIYENEMGGLTEFEVSDKRFELANEVEYLEELIATYNKKAIKYFSSADKLSLDEIEKYLKVVFSDYQEISELETINLTILNYIETLTSNIVLNKKKIIIKEERERLEIWEKCNTELEELRKKSGEFIKQKINAVFDIESINRIYSKIEPHPNLKKVELEPVYEKDGKPKLNMYAIGAEGKAEPTIYLSTAQLNILSLSIFLAQVLNEQELAIDSIFMDDPIEHLDSINTLSFIDLIRSVITDLNIQIIITTHDEKLFNLFKLKINPEYYKAKYLKLDRYGALEMDY